MMDLKVFTLARRGAITTDERALERAADDTAEAVKIALNGGAAPAFTFRVDEPSVTSVAETKCDKWVELVGYHMACYAAGDGEPPVTPAAASLTGDDVWSEAKSVSGDVNGTIGEAVFSLLLTDHYGHAETDFGHLRAVKQGGFPDFEIRYPQRDLRDLMRLHTGRRRIGGFPAEVKTLAKLNKPDLRERGKKAFTQITAWWTERRRPAGYGLLVYCVRRKGSSYDLALVVVS